MSRINNGGVCSLFLFCLSVVFIRTKLEPGSQRGGARWI